MRHGHQCRPGRASAELAAARGQETLVVIGQSLQAALLVSFPPIAFLVSFRTDWPRAYSEELGLPVVNTPEILDVRRATLSDLVNGDVTGGRQR
jgi:hypothetical protein